MKNLLILAAVSEGLTGLILVVYPPIVIRLLFDSEVVRCGCLDESARRHELDRAGSGLLARPQHPPSVFGDVDFQLASNAVPRVRGRQRCGGDSAVASCCRSRRSGSPSCLGVAERTKYRGRTLKTVWALTLRRLSHFVRTLNEALVLLGVAYLNSSEPKQRDHRV